MKTTHNLWNLVFVGLLIFLGLDFLHPQAQAAALPAATANDTCDSRHSIHVTGAAVVYTTPDRALLQLGVQSNGISPDAVRNENVRISRRLSGRSATWACRRKISPQITILFTRSTKTTAHW